MPTTFDFIFSVLYRIWRQVGKSRKIRKCGTRWSSVSYRQKDPIGDLDTEFSDAV